MCGGLCVVCFEASEIVCVLMVCVTPPPDQLEVGVFILSACERLLVCC